MKPVTDPNQADHQPAWRDFHRAERMGSGGKRIQSAEAIRSYAMRI
jgi:hypothetical protein